MPSFFLANIIKTAYKENFVQKFVIFTYTYTTINFVRHRACQAWLSVRN